MVDRDGGVVLPVLVELGPIWGQAVEVAGVEKDLLGDLLRQTVQEMVDEAGLTGRVALELLDVSPSDGLRVSVHGVPVPYALELPDLVLGADTVAALQAVAPNAPPGVVPDALAELVGSIVRGDPYRVSSTEALGALAVDSSREPVADAVASRPLESVLAALLALHIPLTDRAAVAAGAEDAARLELDDLELSELLIARMRAGVVEVRVSPEYGCTLFGPDFDAGGPVPVPSLAGSDFERFAETSDALLKDLGIRLPPIVVRPDERLSGHRFAFALNGIAGPSWRGLGPNERFTDASPAWLRDADIEHVRHPHPVRWGDGAIVALESTGALAGAGVYDAIDYMLLALASAATRYAGHFVDVAAVEYELFLLRDLYPESVDAVLQLMSTWSLTRVLRLLLEGGGSLRDLKAVLQQIVLFDRVVTESEASLVDDDRLLIDPRHAWGPVPSPSEYARYVRKGIGLAISSGQTDLTEATPVCLLDGEVRDVLFEHVAATAGDEGGTALDPVELERIRTSVCASLARASAGVARPVLLVDEAIAPFARDDFRRRLPKLAVVARDEVRPGQSTRTIGVVGTA